MNAKKEQAGKPGFILLHRSLTDKGYYKDSHYVHLWIHILMRANHCETEVMHCNKMIKLLPGQFITGREKLAEEIGANPSKVERILKCFENDQQIEQQTFSKYRIITVLNWYHYQNCTTKRTTREQHVNTEKELNNEDNIEVRKQKFKDSLIPFLETYGEDMLNDFFLYWIEHNTKGTKLKFEMQETWSLERRLSTWKKNEEKFNPIKLKPNHNQLPNAIL
jgi:hypothetical protein